MKTVVVLKMHKTQPHKLKPKNKTKITKTPQNRKKSKSQQLTVSNIFFEKSLDLNRKSNDFLYKKVLYIQDAKELKKSLFLSLSVLMISFSVFSSFRFSLKAFTINLARISYNNKSVNVNFLN